jgi:hypothetical protein
MVGSIGQAFGTNGTNGTVTEDERTAFDERAALCEFDGELPASPAELIGLAVVHAAC